MELKQWLTTLSAELGTSDVTMDDARSVPCWTWHGTPHTRLNG